MSVVNCLGKAKNQDIEKAANAKAEHADKEDQKLRLTQNLLVVVFCLYCHLLLLDLSSNYAQLNQNTDGIRHSPACNGSGTHTQSDDAVSNGYGLSCC